MAKIWILRGKLNPAFKDGVDKMIEAEKMKNTPLPELLNKMQKWIDTLDVRDIMSISDESKVISNEKGNSRWRMKKRALSLMIPY